MYCQYCEEEQASSARFCRVCGSKLVERSQSELLADSMRHQFLVAQVRQWVLQGKINAGQAEELVRPYERRLQTLQAALGQPVARSEAAPEAAPAPCAEAAAESPAAAAADTAPSSPTAADPPTGAAAPGEPASPAPPPSGAEEGAAVLSAALAHAADALDVPQPPPTEQARIIERESPWRAHWRPFLYENIGWFIGAFLLVAGSFYFVAEARGSSRTLLVTGLLAAYATGFWWVGRHLAQRRGLTLAGRVLTSIGGAIAPLALLALGPLRASSFGAWLALTPAMAAAMALLAWSCAGVFGATARTRLGAASLLLLALFGLAPLAPSALALWGADAAALAILLAAASTLRQLRGDRGHAAFFAGALGWLALAVLIRVHHLSVAVGAPLAIAWYGPLTALLAAVALRAERGFAEPGPKPSPFALLAHVALVPAVLVALSNRPAFALSTAAAALLLIDAARRYRSRAFTVLALVGSWGAFHSFSGIIPRETFEAIRHALQAALGYGEVPRLPANFGAAPSLFFLAALAWAYRRARRDGADYALPAMRIFGVGLAAAVLGWTHLGTDLRPALLASASIGLGALALSRWLDHPRLCYLGSSSVALAGLDVALLGCPGVAAAALGLALSALALLAIGAASDSSRRPMHRDVALASAAIAFPLALASTGTVGVAANLAAAAALIACGVASSTALAGLLGVLLAGCAALGVSKVLGVPGEARCWVGLAVSAAFLAASGPRSAPLQTWSPTRWFGLRLPLGASGWGVVREPLAWSASAYASIAVLTSFLTFTLAEPKLTRSALVLAAFAAIHALLARRLARGGPLYAAVPAALIAVAFALEGAGCSSAGVAAASAAAALASVALARRPALSRLLFRLEPEASALPFEIWSAAAASIVALVALEQEEYGAAPLALGALTFFVLAHRRHWSVWLYAGAGCAVAAVLVALRPAHWPLVFAAAGLAWMSLALFATLVPTAAVRLFGVRGDAPRLHLSTIAHVAAALAALSGLGQLADGALPPLALALPALLLALQYALAPRVTPSGLWLALASGFGVAALLLARPWPEHSRILLGAGVVLPCLAVGARRFPRALELATGLAPAHGRCGRWTLVASGLSASALGLAAVTALPTLSWPAALGLAAAGALVGFLATCAGPLLAAAAVLFVAALAAVPELFEHGHLLACAGLNAVFALVGVLSADRGRAAFGALLDLLAPPGERTGVGDGVRRALLAAAVGMAALALLALTAAAAVRTLAFGHWMPFWLAAAMLGAQLATALHQLRRWPSMASWHMALLTAVVGLWLLGGLEAWAYVAGAAAVALALAELALGRPGAPRALGAAGFVAPAALARTCGWYAAALALLSVLATRLSPGALDTAFALGLATAAFGIRAAGGSRGARATAYALVPLTLHFAMFYVGRKLSTGRPEETILSFVALLMAAAAVLFERVAVRRTRAGRPASGAVAAAHVYAAIAFVEWAAAAALVSMEGGDLLAASLAGLLVTAFYVLRAKESGLERFGYLAELAFVGLYVSVRVQTDWIGMRGRLSDADALAGVVFAFVFLGVRAAIKQFGPGALERPSRVLALAAPLAGVLLLEPHATLYNAGVLFAVAVALSAVSAAEGRGKVAGVLAALAYNLALAVIWIRAGVGGLDDAQFYAIPAGLTLIVLSRLYRESLGERWQVRLRTLGVLAIYLSSSWPALSSFERPSAVLWCVFLCVIGVAAGVALRVRAYLYLGTAFLVTCVVGNLIRYGVRDHQLGAAFLTGLGLLIVGFMVFFTARREQLLERYRKLQQLLGSWEV